MKAVKIMYTEY